MAAIELDLPWLDYQHMSSKSQQSADNAYSSPSAAAGASTSQLRDSNPPTVAVFSPPTLARTDPTSLRQRSTILVHQKSPLLVATPPQVTRALAYSHPFIQPLNKIAGLLSWTTGDPWESFLLVACFWAITLYSDPVLRWGGPIVVVMLLILGMYSRRFSTLSSTAVLGDKNVARHTRSRSEATRQAKSLDDIVDNLKLFTSRCSILLDPFLKLTDYLSTQSTATSATTRPALTALFLRIFFITPIWILLTLPPFYIVTTKRLVLFIGTLVLTWHSRPARVTRTILWRSKLIRRSTSIITGLQVAPPQSIEKGHAAPPLPPRTRTPNDIAASLKGKRRPSSPGIRFTFTLFENQRRWLLLGWTASMLAYERAPWTDEHLNSTLSKDEFELPEVDGGHARWRWVKDSAWHVDDDVADRKDGDEDADEVGWVYYDNKWKDGRKGKDGWNRYTRRRIWRRDAELVETTPSAEETPTRTPNRELASTPASDIAVEDHDPMAASSLTVVPDSQSTTSTTAVGDEDDDKVSVDSSVTNAKRRGWFRRRASSRAESQKSVAMTSSSVGTGGSLRSYIDEDDEMRPLSYTQSREDSWGYSEDANMQLG